jgi:TonB family protein
LFARGAASSFFSAGYFKDCWIERRIPRRALVAAALWHVAFIAMPFPQGAFAPKKVTGLENFQLTWSGPIQDLPLLEIPKQRAKLAPHSAPNQPLPETGADAFHPRQRIFTDPVRPTHLKQTLVNPKAPMEAPKLMPELPNMVQLEQAAPAKPRLLISEDALRKLHPRERKVKTVTVAPPLDAPVMQQQVAGDLSLPMTPSGPARPKLEINAGAAPRVAKRDQAGDAGPAPEVGAAQLSAPNGGDSTLIALSATPGPAAPVAPPEGNLAARVSISPDGAKKGGSEAAGAGGKSPVGVSISGGNPPAKTGMSGLNLGMGSPSMRVMSARQHDSAVEEPDRVGPPDFKTLPPGAKPEAIFATKRVYTMNVNMPNLNSATGSWILKFAEMHRDPNALHVASTDLSSPVPVKKVDPKYPPTLISERVEGEVVLYAVIAKDGSIGEIQLVHGIDDQLDANAKEALAQWRFRPGSKAGEPVDLEAIVHIPFRVPARE